jgi:hypothetical protein
MQALAIINNLYGLQRLHTEISEQFLDISQLIISRRNLELTCNDRLIGL